MRVRGLTIAKMCTKMQSCQECIYNEEPSPCAELMSAFGECNSPDKYYKAMMNVYECDATPTEKALEVKIKYHANIDKIEKVKAGDWIDLRSAENVYIKRGMYHCIDLGISMQLPEGYEAIIAPRSSLFRKKGLIQTNGIGIIDSTFCGDNDIWGLPVYATRDCTIEINERICQFRIQKVQPEFTFKELESFETESRGGLGSTGGYSS